MENGIVVDDIVRTLGFLTLGTRMKRIGERLQAETQRIIDANRLSVPASQFPFLSAIDRLGPLTVGELADAIGITQPGATRTLAQLTDAGVLTSEPSPEDQRRRIIRLSEEGQRIVDVAKQSAWPQVEAAVRNLCERLDGPLLDQLAAIEDGLEAQPLYQRNSILSDEKKRQ
jgi:DNA-binding MarR family transcriptional regulator